MYLEKTPYFDLDIVLPCYNPQTGWERIVEKSTKAIQKALPNKHIRVILVDDGSKKNMPEASIKYLRQKLAHFYFIQLEENTGKGNAVRQGVSLSSAKICIYTDVDFPYEERNLISIYKSLCQSNYNVITGSRSDQYYKNTSRLRKLISKTLILLNKTLLKVSITDTQCGLKGFNAKGKSIMLQTEIDRYLFDLEFIYLCEHHKDIKIKATPVTLKPGIVFSKMPLSTILKEGFNFIKVTFKKP